MSPRSYVFNPFTIASPSGKLRFLIKVGRGTTRELWDSLKQSGLRTSVMINNPFLPTDPSRPSQPSFLAPSLESSPLLSPAYQGASASLPPTLGNHVALLRQMQVRVHGPYAAPAQDYDRYDGSIFVGCGSGITPSLAVLQKLKTAQLRFEKPGREWREPFLVYFSVVYALFDTLFSVGVDLANIIHPAEKIIAVLIGIDILIFSFFFGACSYLFFFRYDCWLNSDKRFWRLAVSFGGFGFGILMLLTALTLHYSAPEAERERVMDSFFSVLNPGQASFVGLLLWVVFVSMAPRRGNLKAATFILKGAPLKELNALEEESLLKPYVTHHKNIKILLDRRDVDEEMVARASERRKEEGEQRVSKCEEKLEDDSSIRLRNLESGPPFDECLESEIRVLCDQLGRGSRVGVFFCGNTHALASVRKCVEKVKASQQYKGWVLDFRPEVF